MLASGMLDLQKLHHFYVLVKTGSYARAATELHMSQSALTRNIQVLENRYGVTLLKRDRGRKGILLTDSGRAVLEHVQELLTRAEAIERTLAADDTEAPKKLTIGIGPTLAMLLPDVIKPIVTDSRNLTIEVSIQAPDVMMERVLAGELDFYLGQEPHSGKTRRVRQELCGAAAMRLWVRPHHPLTGRGVVDVEEIARHAKASVTAWNSSIVPMLESGLQGPLTANVQIDDYALLVELAHNSDTILISGFADRLHRLAELETDTVIPMPPLPVYFFFLEGIPLSPFAMGIKEALKRGFITATTQNATGDTPSRP
ncbi:HTH-type transcriptional regulator ArgP [Rhodococcus sp. T7]|nr:HTH-type transcriptional regulator ArgP [Rhodococcus sp. T7]KAF0960141.1 HTH-type transcriptional regulator ArgP [Rhodococcus sp. T7]